MPKQKKSYKPCTRSKQSNAQSLPGIHTTLKTSQYIGKSDTHGHIAIALPYHCEAITQITMQSWNTNLEGTNFLQGEDLQSCANVRFHYRGYGNVLSEKAVEPC